MRIISAEERTGRNNFIFIILGRPFGSGYTLQSLAFVILSKAKNLFRQRIFSSIPRAKLHIFINMKNKIEQIKQEVIGLRSFDDKDAKEIGKLFSKFLLLIKEEENPTYNEMLKKEQIEMKIGAWTREYLKPQQSVPVYYERIKEEYS